MSTAAYKARAILGNEAAGSYVPSGNTGVNEFWDFLGGIAGTPFRAFTVGTGTVTGPVGTEDYSGATNLTVNTDDDLATIYLSNEPNGTTAGGGALMVDSEEITSFQMRFTASGLSSLNTPALKIGLGIDWSNNPPPFTTFELGCFIVDHTISDNWIVMDALGQQTVTDILYENDVDTYLRVEWTPLEMYFWINNELVETVTGEVDPGINEFSGVGAMINAVGRVVTPAYLKIDAIKYVRKFIEPRVFAQ